MDGDIDGGNKQNLLAAFSDDPLAIAMAQSGIQTSEQTWALIELEPGVEGSIAYSQIPLDQLPVSDEELSGIGGSDGALDSLLSAYYYTVKEDPRSPADSARDLPPDPDPDDPEFEDEEIVEIADHSDLAPGSVLPRLVASLGWVDAGRRPPYTLEELAALAICSAPERRLTAPLVAAFVRQVYPYYRELDSPQLQTSLEQALYAGTSFRRLPGRGALGRPWTVTADGERRLAEAVRRRLAADRTGRETAGPPRPPWQEDHSYAARRPAARRVKLATKT